LARSCRFSCDCDARVQRLLLKDLGETTFRAAVKMRVRGTDGKI
jgi:hypothetical protein